MLAELLRHVVAYFSVGVCVRQGGGEACLNYAAATRQHYTGIKGNPMMHRKYYEYRS